MSACNAYGALVEIESTRFGWYVDARPLRAAGGAHGAHLLLLGAAGPQLGARRLGPDRAEDRARLRVRAALLPVVAGGRGAAPPPGRGPPRRPFRHPRGPPHPPPPGGRRPPPRAHPRPRRGGGGRGGGARRSARPR